MATVVLKCKTYSYVMEYGPGIRAVLANVPGHAIFPKPA